jgi:starch synthase
MPEKEKLKILFIAPEVDPFVKAGGLGDIMRALPLALHNLGHDVRIIMPAHHIPNFEKYQPKELFEKYFVDMGPTEKISFLGKQIMLAEKVPVYLIENYGFFAKRSSIYGYVDDANRYAFFCKAALMVPEIINWQPDVIHSNDWVTGLVSNYLKKDYKESDTYRNTLSVFTIHNLAFQGMFNRFALREEEKDTGGELPAYSSVQFQTVNFMKRGIIYADEITTVSETYAREITTPKYGDGLDQLLLERRAHLYGIAHGLDYEKYNPATDKNIAAQYDIRRLSKKVENKIQAQKDYGLKQDPTIPMLGSAHRLTGQKGFDLLEKVLPALMKQNVQLFVVGEGQDVYHKMFYKLHEKYPDKIAIHLKFSRTVAQRVYAASDIFLMPSHYEPGGTSQLIASRYGSVPVVRATGGLADTIKDFDPKEMTGNGFVFENINSFEFYGALTRALETYKYPRIWKALTKIVMEKEFSWQAAARRYEEVYRKGLEEKRRAA